MADRITIQESPWARTASDITQMMLQMQMLKMQAEERETARLATQAQADKQFLTKMYFDQEQKVRDMEKNLVKTYGGIPEEYKSSNGEDLLANMFSDGQTKLSGLVSAINAKNEQLSNLTTAGRQLEAQGDIFSQWARTNIGMIPTISPTEYGQFSAYARRPKAEGGLGWTNTYGADERYTKMQDPLAYQQDTYKFHKDLREDELNQGNQAFDVIKTVFTSDYANNPEKAVKQIAGKLKYTDEGGNEVDMPIGLTQKLQQLATLPNFEDFLTNVYNMPEDMGGNEVRFMLKNHPLFKFNFQTMESSMANMLKLDDEKAGIVRLPGSSDVFEGWANSLEGVTDVNAMFSSYDQIKENLPIEEHQRYFQYLEQITGKDDLWPDYLKYSGGALDEGLEEDLEGDDNLGDPVSSLDQLSNTIDSDIQKVRSAEIEKKTALRRYQRQHRIATEDSVIGKIIIDLNSQGKLTESGERLFPPSMTRIGVPFVDWTSKQIAVIEEEVLAEVRRLATETPSTMGPSYYWEQYIVGTPKEKALELMKHWNNFLAARKNHNAIKGLDPSLYEYDNTALLELLDELGVDSPVAPTGAPAPEPIPVETDTTSMLLQEPEFKGPYNKEAYSNRQDILRLLNELGGGNIVNEFRNRKFVTGWDEE